MSVLRSIGVLLSSVSLLVLIEAASVPAIADDFVVDTATTATNGGNTIDGDDTLTITPDGSIATTGNNNYGADATGSGNAIANSGSISTEGRFAYGIYNNNSDYSTITNNGTILTEGHFASAVYNDNSDYSPVTNSGSIVTQGDSSSGIRNSSSEHSPITNSGTIQTEGEDGVGIYNGFSHYSPVDNSGSIVTEDDAAFGIYNYGSRYSSVTNSGSIQTYGDDAYGIWNRDTSNSSITNSGSIQTQGREAYGIANLQADDLDITNSGSIQTRGDDSHGIYIWSSQYLAVTNISKIKTVGEDAYGIYFFRSPDSTVTNSGYVVSAQSDAFRFDRSSNLTLELLAPSYIGGAINLLSATTVNITTGPSHSVLWDLSTSNMNGGAPNISGTVPWFYNSTTQQFATYDPTAFAGSFDALGDMTNMLSQVGRAGLNGKGLWVTGFGGSYDHDGDAMTLGRDIAQWGVAMGYRGPSVAGFDWGLMAGYLNNELNAESRWTQSYDISGEGWFAGLNARQTLGGVVIDFGLNGGRVDYDQSRFVNDNLALTDGLTLGKSWANSSYAGWFVSPEIGVSAVLATFDGWSFTPAARLRYAAQWLDGFSESGSNANAVVGSRDLGMIEASGEIEAAKMVGNATVSGRIGYLSRISTGDEAVSITLIGATNSVGFSDTDTQALYAGAGFDLDLGPARLALDVTGFLSGDFTGAQAMGQLAVPF